MPKLEILVGMIASGKSLYARRRADEGALVVSHDDLTQMLHARYRYEPGKRTIYRSMEEAIVRVALEADLDVVVDRTHLTCESRKRWVDFAADVHPPLCPYDVTIVAVCFPIEAPEVHAHRRVKGDPRGRSYEEWLAVALHHFDQAEKEPIEDSEHFAWILDAPKHDQGWGLF